MAYLSGFQYLEQRDADDNIVHEGVTSKHNPFVNSDNTGIYDVIAEDLRYLFDDRSSTAMQKLKEDVELMYIEMCTNPEFGSIAATAQANLALEYANQAKAYVDSIDEKRSYFDRIEEYLQYFQKQKPELEDMIEECKTLVQQCKSFYLATKEKAESAIKSAEESKKYSEESKTYSENSKTYSEESKTYSENSNQYSVESKNYSDISKGYAEECGRIYDYFVNYSDDKINEVDTLVNAAITSINESVDSAKAYVSESVRKSKEYALQAEDSAMSAMAYKAPAYDSSKTYNYPNVVTYTDGFTYRCLGYNVIGEEPDFSAYWSRLVPIHHNFWGQDFLDYDIEGNIKVGCVDYERMNHFGVRVVLNNDGTYTIPPLEFYTNKLKYNSDGTVSPVPIFSYTGSSEDGSAVMDSSDAIDLADELIADFERGYSESDDGTYSSDELDEIFKDIT